MSSNNIFNGKRILSLVEVYDYRDNMFKSIIKYGGTLISIINKEDIFYEEDFNLMKKYGGMVHYSDSHYDDIDYILFDELRTRKGGYDEMLEIKKKVTKDCRSLSIAECQQIIADLVMQDITEDNPKIKKGAFKNLDRLTSFDIPAFVNTIERDAFYGCLSLENINIPESVKKIGANAFCDCVRLSSISIPNRIKKIEDATFSNCKNLETTIPDSVASIGKRAFYGCEKLNIVIPESVEKIEDNAFMFCNAENITVPKSVKEIGKDCFSGKITIYDCLKGGINTLSGYITILSEDGSVKYVVPVISDGTDKMKSILKAGWVEDKAEYDFSGLDDYFKFIKLKGVKKDIAKTRLKYPYGLSDEHRDMYEIFLGKKQDNKKTVEYLEETKKTEEALIKKYKIDVGNNEEILKKAGINISSTLGRFPVLFKDTGKEVPEAIIKHIVAKYIQPMTGTDPKAKIIKSADIIMESFNVDSFRKFLFELSERTMKNGVLDLDRQKYFGVQKNDRLLSLLGRFADDEVISKLINAYDEKEKYYVKSNWSAKATNYLHYLREAILLNDSTMALDFAKKKKWLPQYASKRGKNVNDFMKEIGSTISLTEEERRMNDAIDLYDEIMNALLGKEGGYYNPPIVEEEPNIKPISKDNKQAKLFFEKLRDFYMSDEYNGNHDLEDAPEELYQAWLDNNDIEEGMSGFSFTVGIAVASYMFESQDVSGSIVYCRDKWEYRGDYSSSTRLAVNLSKDRKKWGVRVLSGYQEYTM